jgi:hypothetical protein
LIAAHSCWLIEQGVYVGGFIASAWKKLVLLVILASLLGKTYVAGCWQKLMLLVLANFILLALMFYEPSL